MSRHSFVTLASVFVVLSLGAVTACGDDTPTTSKPAVTTTTIDPARAAQRDAVRDAIGSKDGFTTEQRSCLADGVVASPDIDAGSVKLLTKDQTGFSDLDEPNREGLFAVIDSCLKVDELSSTFVSGITKQIAGDFELPKDEATCISGKISDEYASASEFLTATTGDGDIAGATVVFGAFGSCIGEESVGAFLLPSLTKAGVSDAQADCVIAAVVKDVGVTGYTDVLIEGAAGEENGPATTALSAATAAAVTSCG